ncbi:predicted molecular chaperone distantly related to HSP70-fold metalloprotease [Hahella chejuensis KCTC 2396]|uniref:Anhydro-N-acetylmuramic acid kinase n=1 Tax=Hahella chejuensis (strain KCTC 2396) TaxID=349521 RepID=ANMK_HAHCH|nr:anhydro-N-acetylmuramic acid kinase [Hahella chejuensis]Q2S8Y7.1 RecName: Full=Anhydro-N-acetylmuramic acid kinase; AltName: Full=AnhMurNAc kinase [Hahella chejuensis KCTC 2396]ABC32887.1 predicted molecular chaperone distantly related to HSP70-fold metalloprotease [Hahella chejuensis KCTC 2396]
MKDREIFAGLMSGTSLDGVDTALASFQGELPETIATSFTPFPSDLKYKLHHLAVADSWRPDELFAAESQLTLLYAEAINDLLQSADIDRSRIHAIGCHGQTIRHRPAINWPYTCQLGNPSLLAEKTGITVIADFRRRDIAAGGEGAPLAPAFHMHVLQHRFPNCAVVNIGGIANITQWSEKANAVVGFDCGPGNILMDAWCSQAFQQNCDHGGQIARTGSINHALLQEMKKEPFFSLSAPKSTGRELFNHDWLQANLQKTASVDDRDILATLTELTAQTICEALNTNTLTHLFVCGGGAHNLFLMERLSRHLPGILVKGTDSAGIDPDFMEAMAFAWLAMRTLARLPGNIPAVTRAQGERILGAIYPA